MSKLLVLGILLISLYLLKTKKKQNEEIVYEKEDLKIDIKYQKNLLMMFKSEKYTKINFEGEKINSENSNHNIDQFSKFLFIVHYKHREIDEFNRKEKEWYTGYIAFLNITLRNETQDILIIYDKLLNNNLNKNKNEEFLQNLEEDNICFCKIEFYKNGEIKNYYMPNNIPINNTFDNFIYIKTIAELIIPKISSNLYVESINDTLNELIGSNNNSNNQGTNINSTKRNLSQKNLKKHKIKHKAYINTTLNSSDENNYTESSIEEIELEEYLTEPLTESVDYDLREADIIDSNSDKNFSNLTEFKMKNIECDEFKMEDSFENTTVYTIINNEGLLDSIEEITTVLFENKNERMDDYTSDLNRKVYDENNQISYNDYMENNNETQTNFNNITLDFNKLMIISSLIINCTEYFENDTINNILYKYFDSFNYTKYEEEIDNNESLNEELQNDERDLEEINEYYGMKKISNVKQIYKYNLLGLRMEKQILSEIDPSTGISRSYVVIIFGNKNLKIKLNDQYSNLHIVIEKKNQMGYNLILLLQQSNFDLMMKSKNYLDVIINIEKNITHFFENVYDYSNLFKDSLNNMYEEVKNFTGNFFKELINLINNSYDNYINILNDTLNGEYDLINSIKNATKEEYINYIYDMLNILEIFQNKTLIFLEDIEKELDNINDFQIDLLYDIKDNLYEFKLILKQFNKNLFKSIEKGIISFRYDIENYIEEIIGDLLYITDFLSININKNEILINAINNNSRKEIIYKLKDFRNIILTIIDLLIRAINNDYENEMSLDNNKSIKFFSYQKSQKMLYNSEEKSNKVINNIKNRIDNYELFELYSNNIDIINSINNKTIIEFINEIYNNIIYNVTNLQPEFNNEKSEIKEYKEKLFNISTNIINEINLEINDINIYISNYTKNYLEVNIYNFHYNLYYFKKYFIEEGIKKLSDDIDLLLYNKINNFLKNIIDINFKGAIAEFNYGINFCNQCDKRYKLIGKSVIDSYQKGIQNFGKLTEALSSSEFVELIINYINILKKNITKNIKSNVYSINKYFFDNELYKNNFYLVEQISNEINKLIEYFNNYFNEIYETNLRINITSFITDIIIPYQDKKTKEFSNTYDRLLGKLTKYKFKDSYDWDFYCDGLISFFDSYRFKFFYFGVNLMKTSLNSIGIENYLETTCKNIILNYTKKYSEYLYDYTTKSNNLYSNLYFYVQNKIERKGKINILLEEQEKIINEMIINNTNDRLLKKIKAKINTFEENMNKCLNNFYNNIMLLENKYYSLYYLKNNSKFLEYPEEIIYKINQFYKELQQISQKIKNIISSNLQRKILDIKYSTNKYIYNIIKSNLNYILINMDKENEIEEYYLNRYDKLNYTFNKYINILENKTNEINQEDSLNFNTYEEKINKILNNLNNFILFLNEIIEQNFTIEKCDLEFVNDTYNSSVINETDYNNSLICTKIPKQFGLNISKYNYNIVKLREGIYYSKTLIENIEDLDNEIDLKNLINNEKLIYNDELLNDKNFASIYNKTNYKLKEINKESLLLIEEYFELFIEDFKNKYSYTNDYLNLIKKFKEIIAFEDNDFKEQINFTMNNTISKIFELLTKFNETLFKQLSLRENYDYYNFNKTYFLEAYKIYYTQIDKLFQNYKNNISSLKNSYIFHNSINNILRNLQEKKREFFKKIINEFSKNYDFQLLNISYDLGEMTRIFMEKEYYDYEFTYVYDNVELFENYTTFYISIIISYINNLENETKDYFNYIYNEFYYIFNKYAYDYINTESIKEIEFNKTFCSNYSYKLIEDKFEKNKIRIHDYKQFIEFINMTFIECANKDYNFSLNEKIEYISNITNNCSGNLTFLENDSYIKEIIIILDCYNNNFYNSNLIYFDNFESIYINELNSIISEMEIYLKNNYLDEYFFYNYLNKDFQLEPYENITILDISYNLDGIEGMINYINYLKNENYKNYFSNLLIESFMLSYNNLLNNFISNELIINITILVNNRFELYIEYIEQKLLDEYYYYLLILDDTEELGNSTKNAFINLYEKINNRINETIYWTIEEYIDFYLNIFLNNYKKILRNNFIDYYTNNLNKYNLTIFRSNELCQEIILENNFNKTIDSISIDLINNIIIKNIKNEIDEISKIQVQKIFNLTQILKLEINEILNDKKLKNYLTI